MTSKTSFFNKGIYKSTVKRFMWGSVLYFVILFISTVLSIFLRVSERTVGILPEPDYYINHPLILNSGYMTIPILLAIVVPTICAVMIFRFIHAKKQTVFIHSLPVSRKANYISSVLGGLTLMAAPVILNGIILMLTSVCGYSDYFTVSNCLTWLGLNLLGIFLIFSCAVFSATLTGNSFAMIVINILIHSALFIIALCVTALAEVFLFGFSGNNTVFDSLSNNNFVVMVYGFISNAFREKLTLMKIVEFILCAIFLYIASYFLYKKRKPETASDVAGFKALNGIFKYFTTFIITLIGFAIFSVYIKDNPAVFIIAVVIISIIAYAVIEMVLKKTFNILPSAKGYIVFAVLFTVVVLVFSHTNFFGFETRIPDKSQIDEVSIYEYYYTDSEPYTSNSEIIDLVLKTHSELTKNIPITAKENYSILNTRIHIKYKLKNGSVIDRVYPISTYKCNKIMNEAFSHAEYLKKCENVFVDDSLIINMYVDQKPVGSEFLEILRNDVLSLSYEELHAHGYDKESYPYEFRIERKAYSINTMGGETTEYIRHQYFSISKKCVNAIKWIEENLNNQ